MGELPASHLRAAKTSIAQALRSLHRQPANIEQIDADPGSGAPSAGTKWQ
jgi:hypothetical protein